ncbi:hypothetical protein CP533_2970 [Ophiocordyceps camponoti-saundersi (nom. inval.)]|nr:hypothetical protein CP533_2970 [Ophiocordyceps camponoti-saundersi (nom. inval.)]
MKLKAGLLAASSGFLAIAQPLANVYILSAQEASPPTATSLPPAVARLVVQQRLGANNLEPAFRDLTENTDIEVAVSALNKFGKKTPPLIKGGDGGDPSQLVVMLEGVSTDELDVLVNALGSPPTFEISHGLSSSDSDKIIKSGLQEPGAKDVSHCDLRQITNPLTEECWNGKQSAFARFDVREGSDLVDGLARRLTQLSKLAKIGELETTIVVLPRTTGSQAQPQELRRRQAEQVSLDESASGNAFLYASSARIPACFNSAEACSSATKNCSGHGACEKKFADSKGVRANEDCFACRCLSTRSDSGSLTHWAGLTCAKQDVSVAFWLFAGFTIALVFILWLAVSMLFGVGQERLPGVIGAGVSRAR